MAPRLPRVVTLPLGSVWCRSRCRQVIGRSLGASASAAIATCARCSCRAPELPFHRGREPRSKAMLCPVCRSEQNTIRPTRRHIAISPHSGLYAMPSLCGSAEATREWFRAFTAHSFLACRPLRPRGVRHRYPDIRCRHWSHRPEPPEAGETDTDAELPASLKAKRDVPSTAPYERVRSNSIAAGLIQRNRPKSDITPMIGTGSPVLVQPVMPQASCGRCGAVSALAAPTRCPRLPVDAHQVFTGPADTSPRRLLRRRRARPQPHRSLAARC